MNGGRPARLVITADDFGAADEINEAVEQATRNGVLTAASLMVAGTAAGDAVERARRLPGLRVGLHLALVDAMPTLPPHQIPHLVGRDGRLRRDLAKLGLALAVSRAARDEMRAEIEAQLDAFAATGLALDHVNAHEHYHLHPIVGGLVIDACRRRGARSLRVPVEDPATLKRLEPGRTLPGAVVEGVLARLLAARARRAGLKTPDSCFGLRWSGAMTAARLAGLIETAAPGLVEIYLHPATSGGFSEAASGYAYEAELAALVDPAVAASIATGKWKTGGYADA
jgi:hopanoid biosynthesis associated protein HpnK